MLKTFSIFIFCYFYLFAVSAQKTRVKGIVTDTMEKKGIQYSVVSIIRASDSILVKSLRTDSMGHFEFNGIPKGDYKILITYPKMADYLSNLRLTDTSQVDLGKIRMELKSKLLNEVVIQATKHAIHLKGDTLVFQADSFAMRANANVQELLKRLPGIEVDKNGRIKTQGKEVKTVLVDGDEFFGDDPLLATKYLKANAVEEIQVYDKKSKTAELTGIEDGIKNKTINIKLKENAKNGYLSNIDLNSSGSDLGDYGGMFGIFKSKLKAAIYGTYSRLNSESKINNSMRKLKGEDYDLIEVGDDGSSIMYLSGGEDDDDAPFSSSGLPRNASLGTHFSDKFDDNKMGLKLNLKGFNNTNTNHTTYDTQELLPSGKQFLSSGSTNSKSNVSKESIKGAYSYTIDPTATLRASFTGSQGKTEDVSGSTYQTSSDNRLPISENQQESQIRGTNENFNGNINWSKKFKKKGRTLSFDLQPESQNIKTIENSTNITDYYDGNGLLKRRDSIDLKKENTGKQHSVGARVNYTDRLSDRWRIEMGYSFKTISSSSNRIVLDNLKHPKQKVDSLSNDFQFINFSNIGKLIVQYNYDNFSISTGLEATQTDFELNDLDKKTEFRRSYLNLSPRTNLQFKITPSTSLYFTYNGYMQQPSIEQLQPVRQINTPLYQVIGNSALRPSFTHSFNISYNSFKFAADQYLSLDFNYGFTNNAIVATELVYEFNKRISSFINASGNNSISGNFNYSKGFQKLNMRFGFDMGFNKTNSIAIINFTENKSSSTQYNFKGSFNYYTSNLEFSYTPSAILMNGKSSIGELNDGKSICHNHEIGGTIQLPYHIEFNTTFSLSFQPANLSFGQNVNTAIWNSYLSTKLLKSQSLELKLSANDILNQKIGYNRFVGGNIKRENTFSYIPRYVLLGINWNLSGNFMTKDNNR